MDINLSLNISILFAVVAAELMTMLWYHQRWMRFIGDRFFITAIICDVGLAVLLKILIDNPCVKASSWVDALILAVFMALLFFFLEAPHIIHYANRSTFVDCFMNTLHKFCLMFVMLLSMVYINH